MSEITSLNGSPLISEKKRTIILDYDLRSTRLQIGGELDNLDLAINLLEQAARYLRNQQLAQTIIQAGQAMERDVRLMQSVVKQ